jgi:outer membrane receptor protein involved in Fe transport
LYGGQAPSLGLLQVPPTDLYQVEIIKGSASSLYGGSALGGVINLISRQPGDEPAGEALLNFTTRDGQDFTGYFDSPLGNGFGTSLTVGAHQQSAQDIDGDGWIDLASYQRYTARPRLFWVGADGARVHGTLGFMTEEREGGTLPGQTVPDGNPFPQNQDTTRIDGGFIAEIPFVAGYSWNARGSAMVQDHDHRFGAVIEDDQFESYLIETSLSSARDRSHWVVGIAYQLEVFESETFPDFDFRYRVPGLFAEVDHDFTDTLSLSLSGRFDDHSEYGSQLSPRLAVLFRPENWTIRGSLGGGYFAPTPFVEKIEASGLSRLEPLMGIMEETARTAPSTLAIVWMPSRPTSPCSAPTLTRSRSSNPSHPRRAGRQTACV